MSPTKKLLLGLVSGVALGLFLGERIAPVKFLADGFVKLLQMTVLPYLTISLLSSLGNLNAEEAKRVGLRAGAVLALLWAVGIGYAMLFPLVFPAIQTGAFYSTTLAERRQPFNFIDLYIPANPFHSLANNVVPAVVLFSVVSGIALIGVPRKKVVLDLLEVGVAVLSRATRFIARLTPLGVFAIAANTAGTLDLAGIERIQIYLITYAALSLLISFWVLPGLVSALTDIPYSEVLGPARAAFITAFMVGDYFIVLPLLMETARDVLVRRNLVNDRTRDLPSVIVPASFNFPHTGKLLSLSFLLFAGWFSDVSLPLGQYPRLAFTGLLTFFGSLNVAVPFLLDNFRIPADTFQLFLATSVINSRMGTLVAAVHTIVIGLLGSAALVGAIRLRPLRLLLYGIVTVALTASTLLGLRALFSAFMKPEYTGAQLAMKMQPLFSCVPAEVLKEPAPPRTEAPAGVLESIRATGVLRVGFVLPRPPHAFFNRSGELVGFDVEMANRLARDLGARLVLAPVEAEEIAATVNRGDVDLVMSGTAITPTAASSMLFSIPYQEETLGFLVKDHLRDQFSSWNGIRAMGRVKIGTPDVPYFESMLRNKLPDAELEPIRIGGSAYQEALEHRDVMLMPAERGAFLTLLHPEYSIVVPEPGISKVPLAYPIARHDESWRAFVDAWIELQQRNGVIEALYEHWVLGKDAEVRKPRWSVVRDVLHWVN